MLTFRPHTVLSLLVLLTLVAGTGSAATVSGAFGSTPGRTTSGGGASDGWAMPRHDPRRSGSTSLRLRPPLRPVWRRDLPVHSQPVAAAGKVLILSGRYATALSTQDGRTLWRTLLPDLREGEVERLPPGGPFGWPREKQLRSPLILRDYAFFAAAAVLYALELRTGRIRWQRQLWGVWPPPGDDPDFRWGITEEEEGPIWTHPRGSDYSTGGFITHHRGRLLVGTGMDQGRVLALDPATGRTIWRTPPLYPQRPPLRSILIGVEPPTVSGTGNLYFDSNWTAHNEAQQHLHSWVLDGATGRNLRQTPVRPVIAGPDYLVEQMVEEKELPLTADGGARIRLGGLSVPQRARLRCRNARTGRVRWTAELLRVPPGRASVPEAGRFTYAAGARVLLAGSVVSEYGGVTHANDTPGADQAVHAFDPRTGRRLWQTPLVGLQPSPSNVSLVGSVVYALETHGASGDLAALDSATGGVLWRYHIGDDASYGLTVGPAFAEGRMFVGTGNRLWAFAPSRARSHRPPARKR